MTDKEIKKIAREYAKSNIPHGIDEEYAQNIIYTDGEMFERFLGWLSKDYCIVPKEKLDALQDEIHGEIMCAHDDDDWQSAAHYILDVMPRSFNDLFGKDMFKEEKI